MPEPLKSCPFDGSHRVAVVPVQGKFRVRCEACGAEGPEADSWAAAEAAWNGRAKGDGDGGRQ